MTVTLTGQLEFAPVFCEECYRKQQQVRCRDSRLFTIYVAPHTVLRYSVGSFRVQA